jgi:hypothetical protein
MAYVPPIRRNVAEVVARQVQPRGKLVFLFRGMDVQYPPAQSPARALQKALGEAFPDPAAPPEED